MVQKRYWLLTIGSTTNGSRMPRNINRFVGDVAHIKLAPKLYAIFGLLLGHLVPLTPYLGESGLVSFKKSDTKQFKMEVGREEN